MYGVQGEQGRQSWRVHLGVESSSKQERERPALDGERQGPEVDTGWAKPLPRESKGLGAQIAVPLPEVDQHPAEARRADQPEFGEQLHVDIVKPAAIDEPLVQMVGTG